jgi:hypothetical protein
LLLAALTGSGAGLLNAGSLVFFAGSVGGVLTGVHLSNKAQESSPAKAVVLYLMAGLAALGAVYLLESSDAPQGANADFSPLSHEAAAKLFLTQAEQQAFNAELPLINALKEETLLRAERELVELPAAHLDAVMAARVIQNQWRELAPGALSAEAISAVEKVGRGLDLAQKGSVN